MRKLDLEWSNLQKEDGYHFDHYRVTDQYGREWSWTIIDGQSGAEAYDIEYRDEDGIWHESSEQDGVLWDEWTDKNGNEHHGRLDPKGNWLDVWMDENGQVHQGFLAGGEWVDWEPGIDLQGPWTQYTDSHGNVHHWATDQYGRKWDWYQDHHGATNLGYTDQAGLVHRTYEGQDGTWYDRWTDANGTQHVGFEKDGRWYEQGPDGAFHDAADALLPPYIEEATPLGSGPNEDGNRISVFADQYGRIWEWGSRDAQGNPSVGYTDKAGQWHDTYEQGGLWYETFTDEDGNKHFGQVDQNGNVSDGWTDASGTNHDVVWPAGEELYGQESKSIKKIGEQDQGNEDNEDLDALFMKNTDPAADLRTEPLPPAGGIVPEPEEDGVPNPPGEPGEEAAQAPGNPGEEGPQVRTQPPPPEPGQEDPQTRTQPGPGDDQEGQPPVLDPNAQPMPMPSPDQPSGLLPDAPETTLNPGALMDRLLETLANNPDVLEAVADDWGLEPEELKTSVEQIAGRTPQEDGESGEGGVPEPPDDLDGDGRPDWDGDGDGTPNEYGDGPDLDGNGVPDEVGINPDNLQPGYPDKDGDGVQDPREIPDPQEGEPNQPGLTEAEEQALQEAGLTADQIEWVEARVVEPGGTFTMEDPGFTDQQRDVIDGIRENHPGPVAAGRTPGEEEGGEPMWTGPLVLDPEEGGAPRTPTGETGGTPTAPPETTPPPVDWRDLTLEQLQALTDLTPEQLQALTGLTPGQLHGQLGALSCLEGEEGPRPAVDLTGLTPPVEPGNEQVPAPEEGGVPNPPAEPGEEAAPPPTGDDVWGNSDVGRPFQDYMPFDPLVPDLAATGEWPGAEPEDIPGPVGDGPSVAGDLDGGRAENSMLSKLFDPTAPGPTLDPDLLDPSAPGHTLDSRLLDPASPGPSIDPALLDPLAPGPTLDPNLLDPTAPGPTVDPALLDPSEPGETIDPALLDPGAPGPTLDAEQIEQHGIAQPSGGGVAEPVGVTDHQGFMDPSLTESGQPEPSTTPGHDLDDPSALG
jgi:hypothetical protein